jgi:hypothetical protein
MDKLVGRGCFDVGQASGFEFGIELDMSFARANKSIASGSTRRDRGLRGALPPVSPAPRGNADWEDGSMDSLHWIGLFGLALVILGGVTATLFAKRNDELHTGGHH